MSVFSEDDIDNGPNELWMKSRPRLRTVFLNVHLDAGGGGGSRSKSTAARSHGERLDLRTEDVTVVHRPLARLRVGHVNLAPLP